MPTLTYIKETHPSFFASTEHLRVKVVPNTLRVTNNMICGQTATFIVSEEQPGRKGTKIYRLVRFMTGGWERCETVVDPTESESVWAKDLAFVREYQERHF